MRIKQSNCAGRTVRDIVECNPEQVTEVWCRKIFRQLLHSLERQYAMQSPHRAITPDTVIVHDDGARLLPSLVSDPAPEVADDLAALARIVHYAITQEVVPVAPLHGRALEGYSDSLLTAVDRSLAFDPARRPRTIGELRDILGMVASREVPPARKHVHAVQAPRAASMALPALRSFGLLQPGPVRMRFRTWAAAAAAAIAAALLLAGLALFADQREASTFDPVAAMLPASAAGSRAHAGTKGPLAATPVLPDPQLADPGRTAPPLAAPQPQPQPQPQPNAAANAVEADNDPPALTRVDEKPASAASTEAGRTQARQRSTAKPEPKPPAAAIPASVASSRDSAPAAPAQAAQPAAMAAPAKANAAAGTVFDLQIQPWGTVYVDGVKRGISPPVKQLVLGPGHHAILVTNPGAKNHALEVDTATGDGRIAVDFDHAPR